MDIKTNLIKSYCTVCPDSNIILHFIFDEEEFSPKINYLLTSISEIEMPCEILPQVLWEVTSRLVQAVKNFFQIVDLFKVWTQLNVNSVLQNIKLEKRTYDIIEKCFEVIQNTIESENISYVLKITRQRNARIVETTMFLELTKVLESKKTIDMSEFLSLIEDLFNKRYQEFSDKQAIFVKKLKSQILKDNEVPQTTTSLELILQKNCQITNFKDRKLVSQAISMMYSKNRWYSVVTTDFRHLVKNRSEIEKQTLLTVCDPLYFLYHLDEKLELSFHPIEEANRRKIYFGNFLKKRVQGII